MRRTGLALRTGFTLVELLVVIAILGLLMSMLLVAIQKARTTAKVTVTAAEIGMMSTSAEKFKGDFGFYPPQSFTIPLLTPQAGLTSAASDAGFLVLYRMFGNWGRQMAALPPGTLIPWGWNAAPAGTFGDTSAPLIYPNYTTVPNGLPLDSTQCLVFFLGGPGLQGWDVNNPTNLAPPSSGSKRGPYFVFKEASLSDATGKKDFRYRDQFDSPYAYFTTGSGDNYLAPPLGNVTVSTNPPLGPRTNTISPVLNANGRPVNQGTCQIISAGPDQKFGRGGAWTPGVGDYADHQPGDDDRANFNDGKQLGTP